MDATGLPALPDGWVWKKLSEIIKFEKGKKPKSLADNSDHFQYPYINIEAFEKGIFSKFTDGDGAVLSTHNDVLIVWDGARCGFVGRGLIGAVGSTLAKLYSDEVDPLLLFFFLQSFYKLINTNPRGVGIPHVEPGLFWNLYFPLPPLPVQHRIVEKIEELFSQLDSAEEALKRAKANLVRYRQSVLQAAVTGELTREWREAHAGQIEPASVLLDRIRAERRVHWEADLRSRGKDPSKVKYEEPAASDTSTLPELPEGWVWVTVEQVGFLGTGATPLRSENRYYSGGTIPWITSGSLNKPLITEADEYITESALNETNTKVFPVGTLLVAMYGEGKTRGKVSELAIASATNQAIAAITILDGYGYLAEYVKLFLQYNYNNIRRLSAGGVQPNLNLSIIKNTQIPLPPREEQIHINSKIEELFSSISFLELSLSFELKKVTLLRQAILQNAFTGRLI